MTERSSRVKDPTFRFADAPKDRERYPIPGLIMEVNASRWVSIMEDHKSEAEMGNPLAPAILELMGECAAQQHRYVMDMCEKEEAPTPAPANGESGATASGLSPDSIAVSRNDLHTAMSQVLSVIETFEDMRAKEFNDILDQVVTFIFD